MAYKRSPFQSAFGATAGVGFGCLTIVIVIGFWVVVVARTTAVRNPTAKTAKTAAAKPAQEPEFLTIEKFSKIEDGMNYNQVVNVLGEDGKQVSSVTAGQRTDMVFSWSRKPFQSITVMFSNGQVVAKSQIGL